MRDATGSSVFLDPRYYPTRYRDDAVPTLLGEYFGVDVYRPRLRERGQYYVQWEWSVCNDLPISIQQSTTQNLRIRRCTGSMAQLHSDSFLEPLKGERTGHVDLFAKFMSADTIIVGRYDSDLDRNAARLNRNVERLSAIRLGDAAR